MYWALVVCAAGIVVLLVLLRFELQVTGQGRLSWRMGEIEIAIKGLSRID